MRGKAGVVVGQDEGEKQGRGRGGERKREGGE